MTSHPPEAATPHSHPAPAILLLPLLLRVFAIQGANDLPVVTMTQDDFRLDRSCVLVIPQDQILNDSNNNGVIHVVADGITVRFAPGSKLRGAPPDSPWDNLHGIGIRVHGHRRVRIENARVHGYHRGLLATEADGLFLDGGDFSDNYRQRLASTPEAEDGADWLFPHNNDQRKWHDQYGAAVAVESSRAITVRGIRVRRGQNGVLLDRVEEARVYDNDCSFLSGWGLAMWRSSHNVIARNAFDFCVRGHVEGVYNRGQDSAGILCFEQCNDNLFAENSATHGGDGFFGFAGREALGESWMETQRERLRRDTGRPEVDDLIQVPDALARDLSARGCNRNRLLDNDFSYAAAHGVELTFSEDNQILRNRIVENAICGVWGGYSSRTLIAANLFEGNGGMAYGLERGGINIEHGADNRILHNIFRNNRCGVHLWWDDDSALHRLPGVRGTLRGITGNIVAGNSFLIDSSHPFDPVSSQAPLLGLQLRDAGTGHILDNVYANNSVNLAVPQARELDLPPGIKLITYTRLPRIRIPNPSLPGNHHPVGARPHLRGRDKILLDEWGPWDHESTFVRPRRSAPGSLTYEFLGLTSPLRVELLDGSVRMAPPPAPTSGRSLLTITAPTGIHPFRLRARASDFDRELRGTLVNARWNATFFGWDQQSDPRRHLELWHARAESPGAVSMQLSDLHLAHAWGGPSDLRLGGDSRAADLGADHFGMIARTRLPLPPGRWRFTTLSDDGVRLKVAGRTIIENWTWHGPTRDTAVHEQSAASDVDLVLEHFEIDGYAVLQLTIEPD